MTFLAFVGIIVAVALWVHFWLKIHENPNSLSDLLSLIWALLKLLLLFCAGIAVIYCIWWLFEYWDTIELPSWVDTVIGTLGVIVALAIVVASIYSWWLWVKNKWGFKKWLQDKKDKKVAEQKRIANLKWEEKARYERIKKDKKILIIALIIIALLMLPWMIISLFD